MVNGATGSHQRFHPEESMKFKIPYNDIYAVKYGLLTAPIINRMLNNREESRRLASLRDTLLPRLMSGELKVSDAI
jgi:type I restriction enzyme S subunit